MLNLKRITTPEKGKKMTKFISSVIAGMLIAVNVAGFDFSNYKSAPSNTNSSNIDIEKTTGASNNQFANLDFENGKVNWNLAGSDQIQNGIGRNGTMGLIVERDINSKAGNTSRTFKLKPNIKYRVGGWIRAEGVSGEGAAIALELFQKGKYVGGQGKYLTPVTGSGDWTKVGAEFLSSGIPDAEYVLSTYMRPKTFGKACFDDLYLTEEEVQWIPYIIYPKYDRIDPEDAKIGLKSIVIGHFDYHNDKKPEIEIVGQLINGDQIIAEKEAHAADEDVAIDFGKLTILGNVTLRLTLIDRANRFILGQKSFALTASKEISKVTIDSMGRAKVDGDLFMPIGLYVNGLIKKEIDTISNSDFNCVIPYTSLFLDIDRDNGATAKPSIEKITKALNYCHDKKIKVIFSLKDLYDGYKYAPGQWNNLSGNDAIARNMVENIKGNDALLAWYIADEQNPEYVPQLKMRRRLVNSIDSNHPAYTVFYQYTEFPLYGECQEVAGVDNYPIRFHSDNNMKTVKASAMAAQKAFGSSSYPMALWSVVQIHNLGQYEADGRDNLTVLLNKYRYPTVKEITSMVLLDAIYGAKGFLFYSFCDLSRGPDKDQFARRWPAICKMANLLKKLEPFILSDQKPESVAIKVVSGDVAAQKFIDNQGNIKVLIAAVGPGKAEAILSNLPAGLISESNRTQFSNNSYTFTDNDISYDILSSK